MTQLIATRKLRNGKWRLFADRMVTDQSGFSALTTKGIYLHGKDAAVFFGSVSGCHKLCRILEHHKRRLQKYKIQQLAEITEEIKEPDCPAGALLRIGDRLVHLDTGGCLEIGLADTRAMDMIRANHNGKFAIHAVAMGTNFVNGFFSAWEPSNKADPERVFVTRALYAASRFFPGAISPQFEEF